MALTKIRNFRSGRIRLTVLVVDSKRPLVVIVAMQIKVLYKLLSLLNTKLEVWNSTTL